MWKNEVRGENNANCSQTLRECKSVRRLRNYSRVGRKGGICLYNFITCCTASPVNTLCCCNLSAGVALDAGFTTNRMCAKNNTIYMWHEQAIIEWSWRVILPILTCERLNITNSVSEEWSRRWILLLLAAAVRSFARIPLGLSDRSSTYWDIHKHGLFFLRPYSH